MTNSSTDWLATDAHLNHPEIYASPPDHIWYLPPSIATVQMDHTSWTKGLVYTGTGGKFIRQTACI